MSDDENPNKKARVPKDESDGAYKLKLGALGPTNKFQATWFKDPPADGQPHHAHWLDAACVTMLPSSATLPFPTAREFWKADRELGSMPAVCAVGQACKAGDGAWFSGERMFSAMKYLWNPNAAV
eukprot:891620-Pelagomonas_calceolata.AAC.3